MSHTTKIYKDQGGDRMVVADGGTLLVESGSTATFPASAITAASVDDYSVSVRNIRTRVAIADVNTGVDLLPALAGQSYRLISCRAIAYGGAVGALTSVDVSGDDGSAAILVSFLQASLTENTVLVDGGTGATVLAAGASYVANTAGAAISVKTVGSAGTTATGIDFIVDYVIE